MTFTEKRQVRWEILLKLRSGEITVLRAEQLLQKLDGES